MSAETRAALIRGFAMTDKPAVTFKATAEFSRLSKSQAPMLVRNDNPDGYKVVQRGQTIARGFDTYGEAMAWIDEQP